MLLKRLTKSALRGMGLSISRFPSPDRISYQIKELLAEREINLVLDVGAFRGTYCRMLREEAGYKGTIISFEPCAGSFRILSDMMAKDPSWIGFPFGLSDSDSEAVLHTFGERGDYNSILDLKEEAGRQYRVDVHNASSETIQLRKLDTVWSEITKNIRSPRVFMKIDTQGHDTAVIKGAINHLSDIYGFQSELPAIEIYTGMASMPAALELYKTFGYVPLGFYPVIKAHGVVAEFDVVFTRFAGN